MLYLGWIVAAFLSGALLASGIERWRQRRVPLRERFTRLGDTLGRDYPEILRAVKAPPRLVEAQPGGNTLRTWRQGGYSVSLLFDGQDFCLGVMEEHDEPGGTDR